MALYARIKNGSRLIYRVIGIRSDKVLLKISNEIKWIDIGEVELI